MEEGGGARKKKEFARETVSCARNSSGVGETTITRLYYRCNAELRKTFSPIARERRSRKCFH